MDKEIKDILKDLLKNLGELIDNGGMNLKNQLQDAFNQKATISIDKQENGTAVTKIEGNSLAVLITLAGLEKSILEKLDPPSGLYEMIKEMVGTKELNINE